MGSNLEIKSISEAIKFTGDYRFLFTTKFLEEYLPLLSTRLDGAKENDEKQRILSEADNWAISYSLAIYKFYPINPSFRHAIDSSPELSSNFKKMKTWLDGKDGSKLAEEFAGG